MTTRDGERKRRISREEARAASVLEQRVLDERLDAALCETFPASDPVAISLLALDTPQRGASDPSLGRDDEGVSRKRVRS